ncbi:MAG: Na+-driven multidrug efflux pump [Limisphaerales bacterium]|jgi:Na+-driven multidrug efflux pump
MKKERVRGCVMSMSMLFASLVITTVLWSFRKSISSYFFNSEEYASVVGLLLLAISPIILYIGFQIIRRLE